jgi:hypothetical protein
MGEGLTKAAARNIFYGGSIFFFLVFAGLVAHSHYYALTSSSDEAGLTDSVKRGKAVRERNEVVHEAEHGDDEGLQVHDRPSLRLTRREERLGVTEAPSTTRLPENPHIGLAWGRPFAKSQKEEDRR